MSGPEIFPKRSKDRLIVPPTVTVKILILRGNKRVPDPVRYFFKRDRHTVLDIKFPGYEKAAEILYS